MKNIDKHIENLKRVGDELNSLLAEIEKDADNFSVYKMSDEITINMRKLRVLLSNIKKDPDKFK